MANLVSFYAQDPGSGEVRSIEIDLDTLGGGGSWSNITGNISDSADLQAALDAKIENLSGFTTTDLSEGINFYFTDARAVTAIKADPAFHAADWDLAHGWGNHANVGYLTTVSFSDIELSSVLLSTETFSDVDTQLMSAAAINDLIVSKQYITDYTETDPIFSASAASGITASNITNWNIAHGWGDHSGMGYLTDIAFGDIQPGSVLLSSETFADVDNQLMSAAAIDDLIISKGYITSETDSQTLTWDGLTGSLSISGGNSVNLDGRYLESIDLGVSYTTTGVTVTNTGGTDATIATADAQTAGILTASDWSKLSGIAGGAEVNQNAFSNIAVAGQTTVAADTSTDTLTLVAGTNISLTTDAGTDSITINASGGTDAETLDGLDSLQFLRSDVSDTMNGTLTLTGAVKQTNFETVYNAATDSLDFNYIG